MTKEALIQCFAVSTVMLKGKMYLNRPVGLTQEQVERFQAMDPCPICLLDEDDLQVSSDTDVAGLEGRIQELEKQNAELEAQLSDANDSNQELTKRLESIDQLADSDKTASSDTKEKSEAATKEAAKPVAKTKAASKAKS